MMAPFPRLLITLGDVAGIGPEIVVKAWPALVAFARPTVVGNANQLRRAAESISTSIEIVPASQPASVTQIPCLEGSTQDLDAVVPGKINAAAGRAAYDFLCTAIDMTLKGDADAIVTCPLHKEGLKAGGLGYPGHTEILGEKTGVDAFAMMLYARCEAIPHGLGVIHVTLHMALRDTFARIEKKTVLEKIVLLNDMMGRLCEGKPRLALAALNPHASDGGLFGDEETRILLPALKEAQSQGINVTGPWPSDTLFVKAVRGDFDGIVCLYHDQGHIPMKLLAGWKAVNVSAGLPIVRTSVAHGTAYDIAGRGIADPASLIEAAQVASRLSAKR